MKTKITLTQEVTIKDKAVKEIELDFDKVTGRVLVECDKLAKNMGDVSFIPQLSMSFQAMVVSKIIGIPYDDVLDLPSTDFMKLTNEARNFLIK